MRNIIGQAKIDHDKGTVAISVYEKAYPFCKKKMQGYTSKQFTANMEAHLNGCETAQMLLDWERRGIKKEMLAFLSEQELKRKLQKLTKEYGYDMVKDTLEQLEEESK